MRCGGARPKVFLGWGVAVAPALYSLGGGAVAPAVYSRVPSLACQNLAVLKLTLRQDLSKFSLGWLAADAIKLANWRAAQAAAAKSGTDAAPAAAEEGGGGSGGGGG